jgi:hypothetical protein
MRFESGDVLTRGAASVPSGFFERGAVFARVDFFGGIKSSSTKIRFCRLLEQGGCRFLPAAEGAKHLKTQGLDAMPAGSAAVCHPGHTDYVIAASMLRLDPRGAAIEVVVSRLPSWWSVGIFFGWYPAQKATAIDRIDALRFE